MVVDAQQASVAVAEAAKVLKEFHAEVADTMVWVQQMGRQPLFEEPHQGMQAVNGGVLGLLDVIASDFSRLEAETISAEGEARIRSFLRSSRTKDIQRNRGAAQGIRKNTCCARFEQAKKDLEAVECSNGSFRQAQTGVFQ